MKGTVQKSSPYNGSVLLPSEAVASALSSMRRPAELQWLAVLLAIYILLYLLSGENLYGVMNVVGPSILATILIWSCYRIVKQSSIAIWAPLFWFRMACAVYFGFGALVPHIVNQGTLSTIFSMYYFDSALNFKVNVIVVLGVFLTLLFSYIFLGSRSQCVAGPIALVREKQRSIFKYAIGFLVVGGFLRYALLLPYSFGLTDSVLPGSVGSLSRMYYVGIYLLLVHAMNGNRKSLVVCCVLIFSEAVISIASFAKTELLLILIFSFLGFISSGYNKTRMLLGASCVIIAYISFQPLVSYGREQLAIRYGEIRGAGLVERWAIVEQYFEGNGGHVASTHQGGLARLSYMNVNAYVVDRFDAGLPGTTLYNAAAVFVPRVLWPNKPIITNLGPELYFELRGRYGSAIGIGHFAEAYWNFGWSGIAPFMCVLALILSAFSRFSIRVMARQDLLFLPVVFMGVYVGLRVDSFFVPAILGASWVALVTGIILYIMKSVLLVLSRPRAGPLPVAGQIRG